MNVNYHSYQISTLHLLHNTAVNRSGFVAIVHQDKWNTHTIVICRLVVRMQAAKCMSTTQ
jgi:hypothetical protein